MLIEYAIVVVLTMLVGALSIPVGLLLGLPAAGVFAASVAGSLTFMTIVLFVGGRARDVVFARWFPRLEARVRSGRAVAILKRWGTPGLAVVGGILLGPSITLAAALLFDVPRPSFTVWYVATTVLGFALLTGFWELIF